MNTALLVTYYGSDRRGGGRSGVAAQIDVEALYRAGWRSLVVFRAGVEIGRITTTPEGERVWWAESPAGAQLATEALQA